MDYDTSFVPKALQHGVVNFYQECLEFKLLFIDSGALCAGAIDSDTLWRHTNF